MHPRTPPPPQPIIYEHEDALFDDHLDLYPARSTHPSKSSWVGQGVAGIHAWAKDVTPGPPSDSDSRSTNSYSGYHLPTLIQRQGRPVSPTLYTSKTVPAPPKASRPILTPQHSIPSLAAPSATDASLTSITTALSSVSIATPTSEALDDPPSAETQKQGLLAGIAAHLRSWAASSSPKQPIRSTTITRERTNSIPDLTAQPTVRAPVPRVRSPVSFFPVPGDFIIPEKPRGSVPGPSRREKAEIVSPYPHEEHPAFRNRGRKLARIVS